LESGALRGLIEQSWSVESSLDPGGARQNLRTGQCLTTALLVQRYFGGEILATEFGGALGTHYINSILGEQYDFACDHEVRGPFEPIDSPGLFLQPPAVRTAFQYLDERWLHTINRRLPVPEIEHVVIIPESQLAGGYVRPSVDLVVLHGPTEHAVSDRGLFPGQAVWIKLQNGPIVSRSVLKSWFVTARRDVPLLLLRAYCEERAGRRIDRWWNTILASNDEFIAILHVLPDKDLDVPVYPARQARQRTLIALDTWKRKLLWLHADKYELSLPADAEEAAWRVPDGLRYRFRWENLLDETVTAGIDERTRRGSRFHDRVATIDRMLQLFLIGAEDAEHRVLAAFSSEDLDLLADIFEGHSSPVRPVAEVVERLPEFILRISRDLSASDQDSAAHVRWLASAIDGMTVAERIAILDFLQRNGAINWVMESEYPE